MAYKTSFSPRWHHKESDTANLASDATASIEAAAAAAIASIKSAAEIGNPQPLADDAIDHAVNAAGSTGIDFTVAGLGRGASGTVTFTDAADHQLVDVAGNGSFTAGLTDGTIRSPLPASDGAGNTTTATGNSVLLNLDKGLSPTLSVNAVNPTYVPAGETLELASPYSGTVSFAGPTGTLKIDDSASFSGTIAGQLAIGDVIDFANITAGANAKISYSGNNSPGTLTVSDGTHTASIALSGNYSLANFTASSDGHGGTAVVDPPALPSGVTLQQIDGGPTYYASNGFTLAANAGWDNPNFIPIGPWYGTITAQSDATRWHDLDWNTAFRTTGNTDNSILRANGIWALEDPGETSNIGSETVGLLSADEPPNMATWESTVHTTANSLQDGRFWWVGDTWNFLEYGGLNPVGSSVQVLNTLVTTPDGTQRHLDVQGVDIYWFSGAKGNSSVLYEGGLLYNLGRDMTKAEAERGSNYGDMIDMERAFQTANPAPIVAIIEDGGPLTEDTSASTYITPPELNWAVWSSLIHGARAVEYFNHTFAGPAQSDDNLSDPFYRTVQPGQTISIYNQVNATDALVTQLAPVLNSPFAMNYVTVNGPHYSYGTPDLALGGLEVMAKDYNGQLYIFADTRDAETQTNIAATFTIADKNATSVTVVNENRTIAVTNGVFTDTFATAATVHIYEVNDSGVAPPPTAPAAPTIASFSPDTGKVGDGITDANMLTLTGTAVANSTVQVFDGTTQIGTATAGSTGAWTLSTAKLADGIHSFTGTDTVSGATSTASSALTVTVDTVAPNAPVETAASIVSGTTKVQLTGTAEANSTLQVFDGTTQVGTVTANSSGAWSLTTGTLTSGSNSFTATATDVAGNTSVASAALAVTIPSAPTAPAAPTIASFSPDTGVVGDGITDANQLTLKGTAAANSTVKVYDGSTQIGTAAADATGSWDYITAVLTDAKHLLTATDTVSGVTSAASSPLSVTVDTHVPAPPVLVSDSVVNTNHVLLSGTAQANSSITVYDGAAVVGTGTTNSTGTWSLTTAALSSGMNALTAKATDVAGNVSAVSQALDPVIGTAPTPPAPPPPTPPANLVVNGGFEAGNFTGWTLGGNYAGQTLITTNAKVGTYAAALGPAGSDGTLSQSLSTAAGQQYTLDFWLANMSSGPDDFAVKWNGVSVMALVNAPAQNYTEYTFNVTGTAGTSNLEFDFRQDPTQWRLDNISVMPVAAPAAPTPPPTPPAAPQITSFSTDSGVVGDHITNDNTPMLTGTAVANSTVNVFDGTTPIGTTTANSSGQWHLTTPVLSDGTHNLTTTDTDSSGHTSAPSAAFSVTIDTHAPSAPTMAVYSQGGSAVGNATTLSDLVLKGAAEANSTIDIFDGGKQVGTTTTNGSGAWSYDTGHLANGSHSFTATAIDVAGNTSAASPAKAETVTVLTTPTKPIEFTNVQENWNDSATIKGTADAYSQIKIYDGTTSLGTVTASAQGTWSFTTTQLSDTLHTFKAQELDSTGHVVATSSGAAIVAASNTSTLTGTGGDDFLFSSSSQLNDTFVFASNFGHSTVQGFTVAGSGQDTIQFSKTVFDSFASVLSHASQVGQDVVISSGSDTLKLLNTKLGALNSQDFHFA